MSLGLIFAHFRKIINEETKKTITSSMIIKTRTQLNASPRVKYNIDININC